MLIVVQVLLHLSGLSQEPNTVSCEPNLWVKTRKKAKGISKAKAKQARKAKHARKTKQTRNQNNERKQTLLLLLC